MDQYMKGMAGFFWATIILYFISKKKGGRWTTAFRIVAWMFGLGFWYYLTVESAGLTREYIISLVALSIICFIKRGRGSVWKIGFWVSLVYLIPRLILAIAA